MTPSLWRAGPATAVPCHIRWAPLLRPQSGRHRALSSETRAPQDCPGQRGRERGTQGPTHLGLPLTRQLGAASRTELLSALRVGSHYVSSQADPGLLFSNAVKTRNDFTLSLTNGTQSWNLLTFTPAPRKVSRDPGGREGALQPPCPAPRGAGLGPHPQPPGRTRATCSMGAKGATRSLGHSAHHNQNTRRPAPAPRRTQPPGHTGYVT